MSASEALRYEQQAQRLASLTPMCYVLLLVEIFSAKSAYKSPSEVWSSMYAILEKWGLEAKYALIMVVDFFDNSEPSQRSFLVDLLRHYEKDLEEGRQNSVSTSQVKANAVTLPSLSHEIGMRLRKMSHENRCQTVLGTEIEHFCRGTALLVREKVLILSNIWAYMGSDEYLSHCDITCNELTEAQIQKLQHHYNLDMVASITSAKPLNAALIDAEASEETYEGEKQLFCPLHIWMLSALLEEDCSQDVMPYLAKYKGLAYTYPQLRSSIMKKLRLDFESGSTPCKFDVLIRVSQTVGPHFGQDFEFFSGACELCAHAYATHRTLVFDAMSKLILPALSLYKYSKRGASAVWAVLAHFEPSERFALYAQWRDAVYNQAPALKIPKVVTKHGIRVLMRQLTEESVNSVGRSIALLATANPLLVWKKVLQHTLEADERIPLVIKCVTSYSEPLAQDTLFWTILDMIKTEEWEALKEGRVSFTERISRLSSFAGGLFAESAYLQGAPLVTYLEYLMEHIWLSRLHCMFFSQLLTSMSGVNIPKKPSRRDIKALCGSRFLRREVLCPMTSERLERLERLAGVTEEVNRSGIVGTGFSYTVRTKNDWWKLNTLNPSTERLLSVMLSKSVFPRIMHGLATKSASNMCGHLCGSWFDEYDIKMHVLKKIFEILELSGHNIRHAR